MHPNSGAPAHEKNTVHPRSGQDLPQRKTRRLQILRRTNPHPARRGREVRDRPLRGYGYGCPIPLLRLREDLQALPGGSRPRRTDPADARMGCARVGARTVAALREPPSRRLRRIHIAHERMARRPGSGSKRARQTGRGRGRTGESHRRGRDRGSRERREKGRRRSRGRRNGAGSGAGRTGWSATRTTSWSGSATS